MIWHSTRRKPTIERNGFADLLYVNSKDKFRRLVSEITFNYTQPGTYLDHNTREIPIRDFINKELVLFSMADNIRSIPSVVDGFKPGQRKVLFGCFKRNLKSEAKVAQLVGYISEATAYHHGEQSLAGTIVGMAQHFVGNNNINPLMPNGQFGTRLQGGKDHASPRYIFTSLAPITRKIFRKEDDEVLNYLNDDGQSIEPFWSALLSSNSVKRDTELTVWPTGTCQFYRWCS